MKLLSVFVSCLAAMNIYLAADSAPAITKSIDYKSVAEALSAVTEKPGVKVSITKPDGWVIVNDAAQYAVWSFTPEGHYAYPAVVRRVIKTNNKGDVFVEMAALCEAKKTTCDQLIQEFEAMNEHMRQSVKTQIDGK